MKVRKIDRTATVAWSPGQHQPLLAMGTIAGALDASFSSTTELELFDLNMDTTKTLLKRLGSVPVNARIAWSSFSSSGDSYGIIAASKENGELDIWKPSLILEGKAKEALFMRHASHGGPVRGLDFNSLQPNLLASGATDGEIFIWDLNNPTKPYSPGTKSQRLEDITCLAWNKQVPHILATASNNGYTVVWDLRNRREIIKLAYPGGRRPITGVSWNPDAPTELVTVADDDQNPLVLTWNLRNASAPERSMAGHTKGILSVDWCPKDSDLLLTCGKDCRTIVWDVTQGYAIGDLAVSSNWSFDTKWYPRNPDLSFVASYDGRVVVHSLLSSTEHADDPLSPVMTNPVPDDDPFANLGQQNQHQEVPQPVFTLPHPPKWFRRPCGAVYGFGNKLVMFDATSRQVTLRPTGSLDPDILHHLDLLETALDSSDPSAFGQFASSMAAYPKISKKEKETWEFLSALFYDESRDMLLKSLGLDSNMNEERLNVLLNKLNIHVDEEKKNPTPFSLYPIGKSSEEGDIDILVTKALLAGNFESAINICINSNRFADAFALAINSSEDLLYYTQNAYFKKVAKYKPYVRILQSIVEGDLNDVVEHAKLDSVGVWRDLLGLVCSFGSAEDFGPLLTKLGERLEAASKADKDPSEKVHAASLCYIGAGLFEKVMDIWKTVHNKTSLPSIHQMVNLVTVLRQVTGYVDMDLEKTESETPLPLGFLYEKYVDYSKVLAMQGKLHAAYRYLELVPQAYFASLDEKKSFDLNVLMDRIYHGGGRFVAVGPAPAFPYEMTLIGQPAQANDYNRQPTYQQQYQQQPTPTNPFEYQPQAFVPQPFVPQTPQAYAPPMQPAAPVQNTLQPPVQSTQNKVPSPKMSKHPSGDRTHIPPAQKNVFDALTKNLNHLKEVTSAPNNKRLFEDAEKRMNQLFDDMNNEMVPQDVAEKLLLISNALNKSDFSQAQKLQMELMTKRFDVTGQWIVGVKRLIDTLERAASGTLDSPSQGQMPAATTPVRPPSGFQTGPPMPAPPRPGPPPTQFQQAPVAPPPTQFQPQPVAPPTQYQAQPIAPPTQYQQAPVGPPPTQYQAQPVGPPPTQYQAQPVGPPPTQFQPPPVQTVRPGPPPSQFQPQSMAPPTRPGPPPQFQSQPVAQQTFNQPPAQQVRPGPPPMQYQAPPSQSVAPPTNTVRPGPPPSFQQPPAGQNFNQPPGSQGYRPGPPPMMNGPPRPGPPPMRPPFRPQ